MKKATLIGNLLISLKIIEFHIKICSILLLLFGFELTAQKSPAQYIGTYGNWAPSGIAIGPTLTLNKDYTFEITDTGYDENDSWGKFTISGNWVIDDGLVILNPNLKKLHSRVEIVEEERGTGDSLEFKINLIKELYENEELLEEREVPLQIAKIYFNKKKNYHFITSENFQESSCFWAPRIQHRIEVDSAQTFKMAKEDFQKIGISTLGTLGDMEVERTNPNADFFEITIYVPLDVEHKVRSKKVKIKGNNAHYYETQNDNFYFLAQPLVKKKE